MQETKKWPMLSLTVMEWEQDEKMKERFMDYVSKNYRAQDSSSVMEHVDKWLTYLKKTLGDDCLIC